MANTAMSQITAAVVRKGNPITRYAGLAAAGYIPGDWMYMSATATGTATDSDVPAALLMKPLLLDFEPRVASDKTRKDIDDAVAISYGPLIWGGMNGPLIVGATIENPAATKYNSQHMMISNTAGDIEFLNSAVDPAGGAQQIFIWDGVITADVFAILLMY